ncbi:MAG: serine kinase [Gemmatimonadales bacterium]|nr:serine kinase [Gemmatimonadales bacterium]
MRLAQIVEELDLAIRTASDHLDAEVTGGYSSDLMSDVIAHSKRGDLWITLQAHQNIVAVASMNELAGIILVNGREPEDATIAKAQAEGIPIMVTQLPTFELAGRLYDLGVGKPPSDSRVPG